MDFLPHHDSDEDSDFTPDDSWLEDEDEEGEEEEEEMQVGTDDEAQMKDVSELDLPDAETDKKDEGPVGKQGVHGGNPLLVRLWSRTQELDQATMDMFGAEDAYRAWQLNPTADGELATYHVTRLYCTRSNVQALTEEVRHLGQQLP